MTTTTATDQQNEIRDTQQEKTTDHPAKVTFEVIAEAIDKAERGNVAISEVLRFVPPRFHSVTLGGIHSDYRRIVEAVLTSLFTDEPKGLFLAGDVGLGKTAIMYVILKAYLLGRLCRLGTGYMPAGHAEFLCGYWHRCVSHFELVRILRMHVDGRGENDGQKEYERVLNAPLLLIDDIGRAYEDQSGWNLSLLEEFVDQRWQSCKPVIATTNLTPSELTSMPGWARMFDRLRDDSWMRKVVMTGKSRRTEGRSQ